MRHKSRTDGRLPSGEMLRPIPKLCGADVEFGNFRSGGTDPRDTCEEAALALLGQIEGQPHDRSWARCRRNDNRDPDPRDVGRKFLTSNGGCAYIDLDHLELCMPEVCGAYDWLAAWHALLRIARRAQADANARLPEGCRIHVLANNSDGRGNSYGSHFNLLLRRRTWDNIFHRKAHYMPFLASFQVSSILLTGQGKVGSENGQPPVAYQISQRADFFETLVGGQTTCRRPIVNSRNEALCGRRGQLPADSRDPDGLARLHVIIYDAALCHVACLLKVGLMQIILAMIECDHVNPNLILDDPVAAVVAFSHDPLLRARQRTVRGRQVTAIELQSRFLAEASRFVEGGGCDGAVPRAREIIALWQDTLTKLRTASAGQNPQAWAALASRLDWVLKLCILSRAMARDPALTWDSPQIKHLDQLYGSVDPGDGLYWAYERAGLVERLISETEIERFVHEPPEDTRAWGRTMLLRCFGPRFVAHVNWDSIRFEFLDGSRRPVRRTLELADPLAFTKAQCGAVLHEGIDLQRTLDALGAPEGDGSFQIGWPGSDRAALTVSCIPSLPDSPSQTRQMSTPSRTEEE